MRAVSVESSSFLKPPMTYVLLAAGLGHRMGSIAASRPKALIEVAGRPIVEHNVDSMIALASNSSILLVTGHHADALDRFAEAKRASGTHINTVFNPDFAVRGPLRSIEVALAAIPPGADTITIGNGDTIFEPRALDMLFSSNARVSLLTSIVHDSGDDDDVQVELRQGAVVRAAKRLAEAGSLPISAGLLQLRGQDAIGTLATLVSRSVAEESCDRKPRTWHSVVEQLTSSGLPARPVWVPHDTWWEFDTDLSLRRHAARNGDLVGA